MNARGSELLKLVQEEENPTSSLGEALWTIQGKIWSKDKVPLSYKTAVVVLDPKNGDLRVPDNYRGISLISVAIKTVTKVVAARLQTIAERDNLIVREHVGFRSREKCVARTAGIHELIKRRSNSNLKTYALIIDFAKAYDNVARRGMLRKIRSMGNGGQQYRVTEAIYEDPRMCFRFGSDLSEEVSYSCGVRQS